jgi:DHA1 family tetracycline resistance protein-like MFS transporter
VLLISLTASFTGYLLFAFANTLSLLFLSRFIAGAGGANIGTAQAYIADTTTHEDRARGMGLIGAAFGLGFILGPPLSGILSAIGTRHHHHGNLYPGLAAALLSLVAFSIALFTLAESKPEGLVPRSGLPPQFDRHIWRELLHNRLLTSLIAAIFMTLLAVAGMEIGVTLHARERFHFRQIDMAYFFLFMGAIVAVIQGGLIGRLSKAIGEKTLVIIGAVSFVLGFAFVPAVYRVPLLYGVAALVAIGQGLCYPSLTSMVSKVAPETERGSLLGLATSVGSLARFLGPIISGFLYDLGGAPLAFYGGATLMLGALAVAVSMHKLPVTGSEPTKEDFRSS